MAIQYDNAQLTGLSQEEYQRAWVEVDLAALRRNTQQLRQFLQPETELMAVVKADAYGHGAIRVAETVLAAGATWLAVATSQEGIHLRRAGIDAPILVLGAINLPAEIVAVATWQLQPTLCTPQQALTFSETLSARGQTLPVHLNLDTGMSRLGTPWTEAVEFVQFVCQLPGLELSSVYSHFATADEPDPTFMRVQQQRFEQAIATLRARNLAPPQLHMANSAATLRDRALHYDLVRVGLALYGLYPAPELRSVLPLEPALQIKARVTQVKTLPAGTGVSYGQRYTTDRERRIAVVGIGYADGVPRNLSNRLAALARGQRLPQIGAVTMDQLMLDASTVPDLQAGELVTLLGRQGPVAIAAEDWADALGTISWEILCGFKQRLPRVCLAADRD